MKIHFVFILALLTVGIACKPEGLSPTRCRDGKCTYAFEAGKAIEITRDTVSLYDQLQIVNGPKLVFTYEYIKKDKEYIADDEYTENIYFEIDPGLTEFSYSDLDLADIQAAMVPYCFCPPEVNDIRKGSISGVKLDEEHWQVEIDVKLTRFGNEEDRNFSVRFEKR